MLTIALVICAVSVTSFGSPTAFEKRGIAVPLARRGGAPWDTPGAVNITDLQARISTLMLKYENGIAAYNTNAGKTHPLPVGDSRTHKLAQRSNSTNHEATSVEILSEDKGSLWQGLITVGEPAQTFTVSFDTGSADLILPGPDCASECKGRTKYDAGASTKAKDRKRTFELDGSVRGEVYTDALNVAGLSLPNWTIGSASSYEPGFASSIFPADGVLGMAFPAVSQLGSNSVMQALVDSKQVAQPIFTIYLAAAGSELLLGGVNDEAYTGDFTYAQVQTESFWNIRLDGVSVNGTVTLGSGQSMIDTGTSLILAPGDQAEQLYASIPGSNVLQTDDGTAIYTFPCASATTVSFIFGGKAFTIRSDLFNLSRLDEDMEGQCVGAVVGSDQASFWIVGDTFLQNVYTSFDLGRKRVGFADLK